MKEYSSGATRDDDASKLDYEAFISPFILERYAQYLQECAKGRDGDNWQLGIPEERYIKSLIRHVMELWMMHRGRDVSVDEIENSACAIIFNAMGYLYEHMGVRDNYGAAPLYCIKDVPVQGRVEPVCRPSDTRDNK